MKSIMGFTLSEEDYKFFEELPRGSRSRMLHSMIEYYCRPMEIQPWLENLLKDYQLGKVGVVELADIYDTMKDVIDSIDALGVMDK